VATLVAGTGLLVFADPAWAHAVGAVALIACAVTVFALASGPPGELVRYLVSDRDMSVLGVGDTHA
jgi:hypothetical protein